MKMFDLTPIELGLPFSRNDIRQSFVGARLSFGVILKLQVAISIGLRHPCSRPHEFLGSDAWLEDF